MMTKFDRLGCLLLALAPLACDGEESGDGANAGGGTPISCEWFAGDNCFKRIAAEAQSCITNTESGIFSSDGLTCSIGSETRIDFATSPLASDLDDYRWDFDIVVNGSNCASFTSLGSNDDGGFSLKTASGEFRQEVVGMQMALVCPSGERYSLGGLDAFACISSGMPGHAWSYSSNFVSFSLMGASDQQELFDCEAAE